MSEDYIEYLLENNGFELREKKYYLDDHSIFYAAERCDNCSGVNLSENLYSINKKIYRDYVEFHCSLISDINSKIENHINSNIYLFGAHVQSQYLIGFGLATSRVKAILDNDESKHGKRLYGTDKLVLSPRELQGIDSPFVIVRAGTFTGVIVD